MFKNKKNIGGKMSKFNLSWLKLDVNILDDTKIKIIRKYPGGNDLVVLWIGLMCLAMKSDEKGRIYIADGIPYDAQALAGEFDLEIKTIELGLSVFAKYKMIDIAEGGVIEIINFARHQDLDRIEYKREQARLRQAKLRAKLKEEKECNALLTRESLGSSPIRVDKSRVDKIRKDKNNTVVANELSLILRQYNLNISIDSIIKHSKGDIPGAIERIKAFHDKGAGFIIAAIRDRYDLPTKNACEEMTAEELAALL